MTDNKEAKMVNENMDSDNGTHTRDNGDVGTTTGEVVVSVVPTPTDPVVIPKDNPKESKTQLKDIDSDGSEGSIPDLIVDDSEGSEGSIHALLNKEEVKSQNIFDDPELDKLEAEEDNKPWKLEDEMTDADKEYYDKIKNTKVSPEQHFKMAVLKVMSHMDMFFQKHSF